MALIISPTNSPTAQQLTDLISNLQAVVNAAKQFGVNLSIEQRTSSYKMGAKRFSYAKTAERLSQQYVDVMPRQFDPANFTANISLIESLQTAQSLIDQLNERIDDTLMAARIDAMTNTKQVHDSLRMANNADPAYDTALRDLDEFNARASAEDTTPTTAAATPPATTATPPATN